MNLTNRQARLIVACFQQNNGQNFNWRTAGVAAGLGEDEADDLAIGLGERGIFDGLSFGNTAVFTPDGRELARKLINLAQQSPYPKPPTVQTEAVLSERESRFLLNGFRLNNGGTFNYVQAGADMGLDLSASEDMAEILEQKRQLEGRTRDMHARMTARGRENARRMIDADEQEKVRRTGITHIKPKSAAPPPEPRELSPEERFLIACFDAPLPTDSRFEEGFDWHQIKGFAIPQKQAMLEKLRQGDLIDAYSSDGHAVLSGRGKEKARALKQFLRLCTPPAQPPDPSLSVGVSLERGTGQLTVAAPDPQHAQPQDREREEVYRPPADQPVKLQPREKDRSITLSVTPPDAEAISGTQPTNDRKRLAARKLRLHFLALIILSAILFTPYLFGTTPLELWNQSFFAQVVGTVYAVLLMANATLFAAELLLSDERPRLRPILEWVLWVIAGIWVLLLIAYGVRSCATHARATRNVAPASTASMPATKP